VEKINARILNMNYLFRSLGAATQPTTMLSPPLKVFFLLFSHSPASTPVTQTSIFQEDGWKILVNFLAIKISQSNPNGFSFGVLSRMSPIQQSQSV
jgi:hypothetical protein